MTPLMAHAVAWLLGQRSNWDRLGDRLSGESAQLRFSELGWLLAFALGAVFALWALDRLARHFQGGAARPNLDRLFNALCRAHKLDRSERARLRHLAVETGTEHAAHLFVRPDLFDAAADQDGALAALRGRLFAA